MRWLPGLSWIPLCAICLTAGLATARPFPAPGAIPPPALRSRAEVALPIFFEENRGQGPDSARFIAHTGQASLLIGTDRATLLLHAGKSVGRKPGARVTLRPLRGRAARTIEPLNPRAGTVNYLRAGASRPLKGIPTCGEVACRSVYPGIDLIYHGSASGFEYDFQVGAGADPAQISLELALEEGAPEGVADQGFRLQADGSLSVQTAAGELRQLPPRAYQELPRGRKAVPVRFVLEPETAAGQPEGARAVVRFAVLGVDERYPLVIDPVLAYSSYLGGSLMDEARAVAVDREGSVYVAGTTSSPDFPESGPLAGQVPSGKDLFIAKLNATGTELRYATYFGGSGDDEAAGIAVTAQGEACVAGTTNSANILSRLTINPLQPALGGGKDAFFLRLSKRGDAVAYATYLGGSRDDSAAGVAVDAAGNAYVAGTTASADFFAALYPANMVNGLAGGSDAFVVKLDYLDGKILHGQLLGGSGADLGGGIAVDDSGSVCVSGTTASADFPVKNPSQPLLQGPTDAFAAVLSFGDGTLQFSTFLGGGADDAGNAMAARAGSAGSGGLLYLAGSTTSANFPHAGSPRRALGGTQDGFLAVLEWSPAAAGTLLYSGYLGGSGVDLARAVTVDTGGTAYVAGDAGSADLPPVNALQAYRGGTDAFVAWVKPGVSGGALLGMTYLGGTGEDHGYGIAAGPRGQVWVVGGTADDAATAIKDRFPTVNALQPAPADVGDASDGTPHGDGWIVRIDPERTARLVVSRRRLPFGKVPSGGQRLRSFYLTNPDDGLLRVTTGTPTPPFYLLDAPDTLYLPPHGRRKLEVLFIPSGKQPYRSRITFQTPGRRTQITLTGKGG